MGTRIRRATNVIDLIGSLTSPTYAVVCVTHRLVQANRRRNSQKGN